MTILTLPIYDHYFALYLILMFPSIPHTYLPPMLIHPERAQGIFVHSVAALARGSHVVVAEANCEVADGGADFHFTLDHLSPVGDVDGVRAC